MKPRLSLLLLACSTCFVLLTTGASAQQHFGLADSLWVTLDDDSNQVGRVRSNGEIFPAEWLVCGYNYQMYADSTCETDFMVNGFKINGHRWKLRNWKTDRIINAGADLLSFNSRTIDTTLHAGDTISFYRELKWRNPMDGRTTTSNYKSFDTLTCSVELVRLPDSNRVVLLDSIGVLPRPITGTPTIFGKLPIMMWPHWVVPTSLDGIRAFVRVRVRANGSGEYDYTRKEHPTVALWRGITHPNGVAYLAYMGQIYAKPAVGTNSSLPPSPLLHVHLTAGSTDATDVEFTTAADGKSTSLAVYDGTGRLVFVPYSSPSSHGNTEQLHYRFESSGLHLVCLIHDNHIVATNTVTIGR